MVRPGNIAARDELDEPQETLHPDEGDRPPQSQRRPRRRVSLRPRVRQSLLLALNRFHRAALPGRHRKNAADYHPATFQATLTVGNKSKTNGKEDIWNQLTVCAAGMKQLTFWVTPDMMTNIKIPLQTPSTANKPAPAASFNQASIRCWRNYTNRAIGNGCWW